MRKLLLRLAFASSIVIGALVQPAFADKIVCPKTDTSEPHLSKIRSDCKSNCAEAYKKEPGTIPGCKKSCDGTYDSCVKTYQDWDKKKAECRKPIAACWDKCPKGNENQKCMDKCSDKLADELGKCAERAMQ